MQHYQKVLDSLITKAGSQSALARRLGVKRAYVCAAKKEGPGPAFMVRAWHEFRGEFSAAEFWGKGKET